MLSHDKSELYIQLNATIQLAEVDLTPSELQGIVCGQICNTLKTGNRPDSCLLMGIPQEVTAPQQVLLDTVSKLEQHAESMLHSEMEFELLLPDEDEPLVERTQAVADWAHGFVTALFFNQEIDMRDLPADSKEIAQDLINISEAEIGDDPDSDDWALAEIEEYVRVGVQLIYEELLESISK